MKRALLAAAITAIALAGGALLWSRVLGVPDVRTMAVAPTEFRSRVFGTGTVEARVYTDVGSKLTGRVVTLLRDQGDSVGAGERLALLESDEAAQQREQALFARQKALEAIDLERAGLARARASLEAKRAAIAKAQANADLARVTFGRFKALHDRELIARQDLDVRSTELRAAEADIDNLRAERAALEADVRRSEVAIRVAEREAAGAGAALAASESRLRDTTVFAPLAGLIVSREVEPGAVVVPGATLFKMVDPRSLWVRVNVDERLLGDLRVGQPAEVTLRSSPGRAVAGEVARIGEESDRVAEELAVEVRLLQAPTRPRIGEQAEATILTRVTPGARVLAGASVVRGPQGPSVFVVVDGRARLRPVTINARDPRSGEVELAAGLADGEEVVAGPAPYPAALRDGQRVAPARRGGR